MAKGQMRTNKEKKKPKADWNKKKKGGSEPAPIVTGVSASAGDSDGPRSSSAAIRREIRPVLAADPGGR